MTKKFKSSLPLFHPYRHVSLTNPTNDNKISPVEGYTFSVCKSMQNFQLLTDAGVFFNSVFKYIARIDKQNYFVVSVDGEIKLVTKAKFLHYTKIMS